MLGGEVPLLLRREIYVTAALAGALVYVLMILSGLDAVVSGVVGFLAGFSIRALALRRGWSLPAYKARPGRSEAELQEIGVLPEDLDE